MAAAIEVYAFALTIPTGSTPAAPNSQPIQFPSRKVVGIEADVPDGWNGMVGFAIAQDNQQIIPANRGQWIIASGDVLHWNLDGLPDTGDFNLLAYNTGIYPHTLYIRFLCALLDQAQATQNATIAAVAGLTSATIAG